MTVRLTVLGYFGRGNLGDEALLSCTLGQIRRRFHGAEVVVLGFDPGRITRDFGVEAIPAVGGAGRWARWRRLARSDLVLIGGGGLLKDWGNDSATMAAYCLPALAARALGRPVAFTGVGVGPVRHPLSRRLLAAAARTVNLLWVRDELSRRWIERCGGPAARAWVAPDPAFAFPVPDPAAGTEEVPPRDAAGPEWIGVNLRHWYRRRFGMTAAEHRLVDLLLDRLAAAFVRLSASSGPVKFVALPFRTESYDDDSRMLEALASRLPRSVEWVCSDRLASPAAMRSLLGRCALVIGMRLHACILSAAAGTPFLALAYDEKVEGAAASVGREEDVVPFNEEAVEALPSRVEAAWKARRSTAEVLRARMPEVRQRIAYSWDLAFRPLGAAGGSAS